MKRILPIISKKCSRLNQDGRGRTATFIRVNTHPTQYLVGGYNPLSWSSINDYNTTENNDDRTAFIFNLTSNFIQRQKLRFFICPGGSNDPGFFQTYNHEELGPIFGQGADIWVDADLEHGTMWNYSYGTTCHSNHILNINYPLEEEVDYVGFEVFKIALTTTAANVSIGGRVSTFSGNGIGGVRVTLSGATGISRTALTSPFGYYQFDEVEAGRTYFVSISAKGYSFSQPVQVVNVQEQLGNINFIAGGLK